MKFYPLVGKALEAVIGIIINMRESKDIFVINKCSLPKKKMSIPLH